MLESVCVVVLDTFDVSLCVPMADETCELAGSWIADVYCVGSCEYIIPDAMRDPLLVLFLVCPLSARNVLGRHQIPWHARAIGLASARHDAACCLCYVLKPRVL